MIFTYRTIERKSESLFKDRGSKFLGHTFPVNNIEEIRNYLLEIKNIHPKAVHHCYAYRLGTDGTQFRANDDGEPSGSAGKPILGQIDSAELTNILIVVTRYFGGSLLGVPGLINAYKTAAHEAINASIIIEKNIEKNISLEFNYDMMNEVMTILKQHQTTIIKQELQLFCSIEAGIPLKEYEVCFEKLKNIYQLQIK